MLFIKKALEEFACALQEAQRLANQFEREEAAQKPKQPKTYLGGSRMMLYHHEKLCKTLASKDFLDIGSFLALQEAK